MVRRNGSARCGELLRRPAANRGLIAEAKQGDRPALEPFDGAALAAAPHDAVPAMLAHNLALAEARSRPVHPAARLAPSLLTLADVRRAATKGSRCGCWPRSSGAGKTNPTNPWRGQRFGCFLGVSRRFRDFLRYFDYKWNCPLVACVGVVDRNICLKRRIARELLKRILNGKSSPAGARQSLMREWVRAAPPVRARSSSVPCRSRSSATRRTETPADA